MRRPILSVLLLGVMATVLAEPVSAQAYRKTFLGFLGSSSESSCAYALNDYGEVTGGVGWAPFPIPTPPSSGDSRTFVWGDANGMRDSNAPGAWSIGLGISNSGEVVGRSSGTGFGENQLAFLIGSDGTLKQLGPFSWGDDNGGSNAEAINNAGVVVGTASYKYGSGFTRHAFVWDSANGFTRIGSLGAEPYQSFAHDINDSNVVVGHTWSLREDSFIWDSVNGIRQLPILDNAVSFVYAINNQTQVVGRYRAGSQFRPYMWDPVNGFVDLGVMNGGQHDPYDINDLGQVVGRAEGRAFVWDATNGFRHLGPGEAHGINNRGQIVGCTLGEDNIMHAVLWEPVPEPSTALAMLAGLAGLALVRRRRS